MGQAPTLWMEFYSVYMHTNSELLSLTLMLTLLHMKQLILTAF